MNMRRKSQQSGGYNNPHRRPRHSHGGSSGGQSSGGHNRPRKNYPALREKYLTQARDALAQGERVLAENYFQHADHCYRMMMEEGSHRQPQPQEGAAQESANAPAEEPVSQSASVLPAFLTVNYEGGAAPAPVDPATIQNWEDRDA